MYCENTPEETRRHQTGLNGIISWRGIRIGKKRNHKRKRTRVLPEIAFKGKYGKKPQLLIKGPGAPTLLMRTDSG